MFARIYHCSLIVFFLHIFSLANEAKAQVGYEFGEETCNVYAYNQIDDVKRCTKATLTRFDLSLSPELFCGYRVRRSDSIGSIYQNTGYYRDRFKTRYIDAKSGRLTRPILIENSVLLFSRRDLTSGSDSNCVTPNESDRVFYTLEVPTSFYALRSGLKRRGVDDEDQGTQVETAAEAPLLDPNTGTNLSDEELDTKEKSQTQTSDAFHEESATFSLRPYMFFESLEGTQISNQSTAELKSEISPALEILLETHLNTKLSLHFNFVSEFHLYEPSTNLFQISNNNINTMSLGLNFIYKPARKFHLFLGVLGAEELFYTRSNSTDIELDKDLLVNLVSGFKWIIFKNDMAEMNFAPYYRLLVSENTVLESQGFATPLEFLFRSGAYNFGVYASYENLDKETADLEIKQENIRFGIVSRFSF